MEEFESIHTAHPKDVSVSVLLGYTYIKAEKEAQAAQLLQPIEAGNEGNTQLEYVLAYSLIRSGKAAEGLPRMERVALATHSADPYLIAGSARFYGGQMGLARADLDEAVKLNPSLPGLQTLAGQARYFMKDMPGATDAFEAALHADPMDFVANRDLGAMRLQQGDLENAKPLLELALQLHPTDPLTRIEIAKVNDAMGKYAEAAAILEDLVKAEPNWRDAHWVLANVYSELNRQEDGRRERAIAQQIEARQKLEAPPNK